VAFCYNIICFQSVLQRYEITYIEIVWFGLSNVCVLDILISYLVFIELNKTDDMLSIYWYLLNRQGLIKYKLILNL